MKNKFLKCSLAIVGLTIGLASCEKENQTTEETSVELQVPEKIISFNKAVDEYNNFYNTRIAPFKGKSNLDETRAVWFDLESLENHLEKIETVAQEKGIQVSHLGFVLGANTNNVRTITIAPMASHPDTGENMPFSINNNQITFLDNNAFDKYSNITDLNSLTDKSQSLLLSTNGYISSAQTIEMYNNYYDTKVAPLYNVVANDSRICFYTKETFKNYITYIKRQAVDNNISLSGFNIVFGVYGDNPTLGREFANHQTLFFAPTKTDTKSNDNKSYNFNGESIINIDFSQNILEKIISKLDNVESSSLANEIAGAPPMGIE
ncbi:hypothetical protein [uncultured Aquimarina sp.]|uniref:hypothetical protein n=1 Tax=uncultured Aquimarina sp. TaxID=575652 RepID=UPI00263960AA|nr:hypothetical protein [uncultured Aquimarina sp.]